MNDQSTLPGRRPDDDELFAYAEGRLPADTDRGRQITAWLQRDQRARTCVTTCRAQDQAIRRHYAAVLGESIPDHLRVAAVRQRLSLRDRRWGLAVAASVTAVAVLTSAWIARPQIAGPVEASELDRFAGRISRQLLTAGTTGSGGTDTLQPLSIGDPALSLAGFTAAGARRLQVNGSELREVRYRDGHGRQLSLFVGEPHAAPPDPMRWQRAGNTQIVYWEQDGRLYALAGELPQDVLSEVAAGAAAQTTQRRYADADADAAPSTDVFADLTARPLTEPSQPATAQPLMAGAETVHPVGRDDAVAVETLAPDTPAAGTSAAGNEPPL